MSENKETSFTAKSLTDAKTFKDTYMMHKRGILSFAFLLIFVGFIVYLQICGASCSGSDPCGVVGMSATTSNGEGDDPDQLNGTAYGAFITIAVLFLCVGIGIATWYSAIAKKSSELADNGELVAAIMINGNKNDTRWDDPTLLKFQTAKYSQRVIDIGEDPAALIENDFEKNKFEKTYQTGFKAGMIKAQEDYDEVSESESDSESEEEEDGEEEEEEEEVAPVVKPKSNGNKKKSNGNKKKSKGNKK